MPNFDTIPRLSDRIREAYARRQQDADVIAEALMQIAALDPDRAADLQEKLRLGGEIGQPLEQIQRAHDILHMIAAGELPRLRLLSSVKTAVHAAHDVLGWVLVYPCAVTFQENLDRLERQAAEAGYILRDTGETRRRP